MMKLVPADDPVLRVMAKKVTDISSEVEPVINQMIETLHAHRGIGLAAPQVGISLAFFLFHDGNTIRCAINPTSMVLGKTVVAAKEGCLSLPGTQVYVKRPYQISASFTSRQGKQVSEIYVSNAARCFQHELDHLRGILITDKPVSF